MLERADSRGPNAVPPGLRRWFNDGLIVVGDVAANFFAWGVGMSDFTDVGGQEKYLQIVLLGRRVRQAVTFGPGGEDERTVGVHSHLPDLLVN